MASVVFAIRQNFRRVCSEVSQVLSKISTTSETREKEFLGESLFAISDEGWESEKVIAWANEPTLG